MDTVKMLSLKKETLRTLGQEPEHKPGAPGTTTDRTVACTVCHTC
ncbi:MAG TPA: hypothetical protein VH988_01820 [Thermoanaerobaculia bacterium]|jgi:hypothetical protein|nr:hypothetical protein [Thermoanaerobaculia bacterium]